MTHPNPRICALPILLMLGAMTACNGNSSVANLNNSSRAQLQSIDLGRLVDIYAYQRTDESGTADRRIRFNRRFELVARNVVINPGIESQSLFDAAGEEVRSANYEFLPFDKRVGHEELVILWDNRPGAEAEDFQRALDDAQVGLVSLAPSYRGQNTQTRPIPIVPRNAAIRMQFSGAVDVDSAFFAANPSAIQLLEFKGDPDVVQAVDAFRVLPYRVIPQGSRIVLDTTILGGEGAAGGGSPGLPESADQVTANIRIAIPSRGGAVSTFYVLPDTVEQLNGVDSAGRNSVIRDFRSGNLSDGVSARVREPEAPMIVASLAMGITAIDAATNEITLNKRSNLVPIRGRYPFVDGPLQDGIPLGPLKVPTSEPLASGDMLIQTIQVEMPDGTFESVRLRAEILENLEVGTRVGPNEQPLPEQPNLGLAANAGPGDSGQGETITTPRVRVATLMAGRDSLGRLHSFRANSLPEGHECLLRARYYEDVPLPNGTVSDAQWRHLFVRIDPQPQASAVPASLVQPNASIAVEFTKPMDLDQVDNTANLLITNTSIAVEPFPVQMATPKRAILRIVPARLSDVEGDGTVLRLQPQMGFFHRNGTAEVYSAHVRLGNLGVTDLAGNTVKVFDRPATPQASWSVDFSLAPSALENRVAWRTYTFEAEDEDPTLPGSPDIFGQYRLEKGRLVGAEPIRFSRTADQQNLQAISRINRGECWEPTGDMQLFPINPPPPPAGWVPTNAVAGAHPGLLYWQPKMTDTILPPNVPQVYEYWQSVPQPVGRVVEPHKPQGSRMQMRYLEDDFSLSYTQPSEFGIDVDQLYWSPFNDETVLYDVFDRYTMSLAHSVRRPDERWLLVNDGATPPAWFCTMDCASMNSSLSLVFSDNVLEGTQLVPVLEDKVYTVNPNEAFRSADNIKYVPYPRFDRSYTWRDSRLVSVDATGQVIGLGGALQPNAQPPNSDRTANIDSPWVTSVPDPEFVINGGAIWVEDQGDFRGEYQRDHDPIALPLLVDFKVFPDSPANGIVSAANGFQMAMLGGPSGFTGNPPYPGSYYDQVPSGCGGVYPAWPRVRVHASGGEDLVTHADVLIDPANQLSAQASWVKDAGLGEATRALFRAPPGDGMLNWARADFVRKVSTMTFGFFDSLNPQRFQLANFATGNVESGDGFPDLDEISANLRISDLVVQLDPPQARQPAGTSVVVEIRGAETFTNSGSLYNPTFTGFNNEPAPGPQNASDAYDTRGNLLNPNYACEAYRYSTPNALGAAPRVAASGLTQYVTEDQLPLIRTPGTGLLPRYLNLRLVMTNNVDVTPGLSPSLRSMSVVYRVQ